VKKQSAEGLSSYGGWKQETCQNSYQEQSSVCCIWHQHNSDMSSQLQILTTHRNKK